VLRAYQECCAICRLRHDELLEAAHILPDGHPLGEPIIPNGLALCKLHHAAFDRYLIGVTPDLEVTVRLDVLEEIDGPMLQHGLQGFQGLRIHVPRADHLKPNRDFLAGSATHCSGARAEREILVSDSILAGTLTRTISLRSVMTWPCGRAKAGENCSPLPSPARDVLIA